MVVFLSLYLLDPLLGVGLGHLGLRRLRLRRHQRRRQPRVLRRRRRRLGGLAQLHARRHDARLRRLDRLGVDHLLALRQRAEAGGGGVARRRAHGAQARGGAERGVERHGGHGAPHGQGTSGRAAGHGLGLLGHQHHLRLEVPGQDLVHGARLARHLRAALRLQLGLQRHHCVLPQRLEHRLHLLRVPVEAPAQLLLVDLQAELEHLLLLRRLLRLQRQQLLLAGPVRHHDALQPRQPHLQHQVRLQRGRGGPPQALRREQVGVVHHVLLAPPQRLALPHHGHEPGAVGLRGEVVADAPRRRLHLRRLGHRLGGVRLHVERQQLNGQPLQLLLVEALLVVAQQQRAGARLAGAARAAQALDVHLLGRRGPHLHHRGDVRVVHASGADVRRQHDLLGVEAEGVGRRHALAG
mmetsp:Transcript_28573/g.70422  ORF Transcript_28573/g.70422 Transcript_28573/m.70422 type:complete len:410 (-) Transcript_28573:528-1757(-)